MGRSLNPAPGSPRPMQRGVTNWAYGNQDVTIAATDVLKSRVNLIGAGIGSTISGAPGVMGQLINSTTLRLTHVLGGGADVAVSWEIESWN